MLRKLFKPPASCTLWCLQIWHRMNGGFISWSNPHFSAISCRVCEHQAVIRIQPQNNNQKPFVSHIKRHQDWALTGLLDWGGMGQLQCSQTSSKFSIQSLSESVLQEQPIVSAIWGKRSSQKPSRSAFVHSFLTSVWLCNGEWRQQRMKENVTFLQKAVC